MKDLIIMQYLLRLTFATLVATLPMTAQALTVSFNEYTDDVEPENVGFTLNIAPAGDDIFSYSGVEIEINALDGSTFSVGGTGTKLALRTGNTSGINGMLVDDFIFSPPSMSVEEDRFFAQFSGLGNLGIANISSLIRDYADIVLVGGSLMETGFAYRVLFRTSSDPQVALFEGEIRTAQPIPLPAGGVLLLSSLSATALLRRRRGSGETSEKYSRKARA